MATCRSIGLDGWGVGDSSVKPDAVSYTHLDVYKRQAHGSGVYGVSTGFGALATRSIPPGERARLQRSLIRSHAAGSGELVEPEVVRAMMLLRLATLAKGFSGVRLSTAEAYATLLNSPLVPVVREYGSLGCSGDLAPLASCALALTGEGEVLDDGVVRPAAEALACLLYTSRCV